VPPDNVIENVVKNGDRWFLCWYHLLLR